ncbi:hypothetical protein ACHAXR_013318 [Thalassiosira sp. AJA248-18]
MSKEDVDAGRVMLASESVEEPPSEVEEMDEIIIGDVTNNQPTQSNRNNGWRGQTCLDTVQFCASGTEGHHNCPYEAVCPFGPDRETIDRFTFSDGGCPAWVPISDIYNEWVNVGRENEYSLENRGQPNWGIRVDIEEITRRVLCYRGSIMGSVEENFLCGCAAETYQSGWEGITHQDTMKICGSRQEGSKGVMGLCLFQALSPKTDVGIPLIEEAGVNEMRANESLKAYVVGVVVVITLVAIVTKFFNPKPTINSSDGAQRATTIDLGKEIPDSDNNDVVRARAITNQVEISSQLCPSTGKEDQENDSTEKNWTEGNVKPLHSVGDVVWAGWWEGDDQDEDKEVSWHEGKIDGIRTLDHDGRYGPRREYSVSYIDGDAKTVPDHFVMGKEEYAFSMINDQGPMIKNIKDETSNDDWARIIGWYEVEINGETVKFSKLSDAFYNTNSVNAEKNWTKEIVKPLHSVGEVVWAGWWEGSDQDEDKEVSWHEGKIDGIRTLDRDGRYGPRREYSVSYIDGDAKTVPDHFVMGKEEYAFSMINDQGPMIKNIKDETSNDDWARIIGWYEVEINGETVKSSKLSDAFYILNTTKLDEEEEVHQQTEYEIYVGEKRARNKAKLEQLGLLKPISDFHQSAPQREREIDEDDQRIPPTTISPARRLQIIEEIQSCPSTKKIEYTLLKGYDGQCGENFNSSNVSIQSYVEKKKSKGSTHNQPDKNGWVNDNLMNTLWDKSADRNKWDAVSNQETKKKYKRKDERDVKSSMSIEDRLDFLLEQKGIQGTSYYFGHSEKRGAKRIAINVSTTQEGTELVRNTLLPAFLRSASHDIIGTPLDPKKEGITTLMFGREEFDPGEFQFCELKHSEFEKRKRKRVICDVNGMLAKAMGIPLHQAKKMCYYIVHEYVTDEEIVNARNLAWKLGQPSCFLSFLVLLCSFDHMASRKACAREKDFFQKENDKEKMTEAERREFRKALDTSECFMKSLFPCVIEHIVGRSHLKNLKRLAWPSWNGFAISLDPIMNESELKEKKTRRAQVKREDYLKCKNCEATMGMMITQESKDETVEQVMRRLTPGFNTAESYLGVLQYLTLNEFFELLVELTRDSSMYCTKANSLLMLWVVSCIRFGGDVPMDMHNLTALPQVGIKKSTIIRNLMANEAETGADQAKYYSGVGADVHVKNLIKAIVKEIIPNFKEHSHKKSIDKYTSWICEEMAIDPGIYFNEIAGEVKQSDRGEKEWAYVIDVALRDFIKKNPSYTRIVYNWMGWINDEEKKEINAVRKQPCRRVKE